MTKDFTDKSTRYKIASKRKQTSNNLGKITCVWSAQLIGRSLSNADGVTFILYCTLFHSRSKALVESTVATLISFILVNETIARVATGVSLAFPYGPPEKTFAAIAGGRTVVFPGGSVPANGAKGGRSIAIGSVMTMTAAFGYVGAPVTIGRSGSRESVVESIDVCQNGRHLHLERFRMDDVAHSVPL